MTVLESHRRQLSSSDEQIACVSDHYISIEKKSTQQNTQSSSISTIVEGQNPSEAVLLMSYINQYRVAAGINELAWNEDLEQTAQALAEPAQSENQDALINLWFCYPIGRQCNGAKTAQRAVSDWIEGNQWVPSESDVLLSGDFTQMGELYIIIQMVMNTDIIIFGGFVYNSFI